MPVLDVRHVTKAHGAGEREVIALADVSLQLCAGEAMAVVGHNGAGKSTLLRLLTGIAHVDAGSIEVMGHPIPRRLDRAAGEMGCLIDRPGFLGGLSGHANLEIIARRHGLGGSHVHQLLDRCGISDEARRRVFSSYSLGMRGRLGIAVALLGDPALLILDEPTNGLDPAGISWIRRLIREHTECGGSVLLASHLLTEVEAVCDQVVVLHHGRVAERGSLTDVLAAVPVPIVLEVSERPEEAADALASHGIAIDRRDGHRFHIRTDPGQRARLSLIVAQTGIGVVALEHEGSALEHVLANAAEQIR